MTEDVGAGEAPTDSNTAVVIEATAVSKRFPQTWGLRKVDLRVERGERVGLIGPNGSGKSTLLRILSTAARPTYGAIRVFGLSPRTNGDAVRSRVGFLSHQVSLYQELTALENLRFAATMYGLDRTESQLLEALDHVGLAHVAASRVHTFSSGMRKRLALARSTLHDPQIVLLDEPYGALDTKGMEWVDTFIGAIRGSHKTAIVATHEVNRALELCDRIVALRAGRVVFDGPAESFTPLPEEAAAEGV